MEEDLTACNGGGIVFQDTCLTWQIRVQSHTLCQTSCNKKQMQAGVSNTHRPVSSAGLLELCQSSHHIVSESDHVAKNTPGW